MSNSIGLVGFEPTASWSRTRRSTKLSHSPKWNTHSGVRDRCASYFAYFYADSKEIEFLAASPAVETIGEFAHLDQLLALRFR